MRARCDLRPNPEVRSEEWLYAKASSGWLAYADPDRSPGWRQFSLNDVSDHFESTGERESGILVNAHSAELLEKWVWFAPPGFPDSVRMSSNNL